MSHVGNGEHDFDNLEVSEILNEETKGRIKQARIEARDIIDRLEPFHISSWADLLTKLDDCHKTAIRNARLLDPAFRERWEQELREEKGLAEQQRMINKFFRAPVIVICVLFAALIAGSFTNLPIRVGLFVWWVIFPIIIVAVVWFCFFSFGDHLELVLKSRKGESKAS